jgi:hypothetical protein
MRGSFCAVARQKALFRDGDHMKDSVPARPHAPSAPITINSTVE